MFKLLKDSVIHFAKDNAPRHAAALAYYSLFSIAPLLIIAVAIIGAVYGEDAAQGLIVDQLGDMMGEGAARYVEDLIVQAARPTSGITATLISVAILLWGASRVFNHLRASINSIWHIRLKEKLGIVHKIKMKAFALILVLFSGLFLLATAVLNTVIFALIDRIEEYTPTIPFLWQTVNFFFLYAVTTFIFALILKYIPNAKLDWITATIGALFTSFLFSVGRILLGIYLSEFSVTSTYGAAGSLVAVLIWLYYSAQILFLGAEFTQQYANSRGTPIEPSRDASAVKIIESGT
ncbi:YihY/virulence factor BrkB family protein [Chitinispirillales bacterium ANBcel5]|uniref:YihY/virulence factor BrkB family protein n=1 Tax=Cellulosispirillum alkaliphilum TaxID=3039283 RepID=UPI002A4E79F4|nr:YihY/virulence factor BrkB family protein [Chitinispirillales bacterium ANBcel5]